MSYAVELFFDHIAENQVRDTWIELKNASLPCIPLDNNSRPHVSLAVFKSTNLEQSIQTLEDFAKNTGSFEIKLNSIGTFPHPEGVVFYNVILNSELESKHREVEKKISQFVQEPSPFYSSDNWQPHCTLAWKLSIEQINNAIKVLLDRKLPLVARVDAIALVEYPGHHEIAVFKF
jgi:2'-5' RNA ligase